MKCRAPLLLIPLLASASLAQTITDPNLSVQTWVTGMNSPTGIAFLPGSDDALVIQKNNGRVRLIQDRALGKTVLNLDVANNSEQGLLGITLHPDFDQNHFVYLYYTKAKSDGAVATRNRIDRFTWTGDSLEFDKNILKMPVDPGPNHNGGKIAFGPDKKLYAVIGDVNRNGRTQNYEDSDEIARAGVVLRLNAGGKSPKNNPFYDKKNIGTKNRPLNDIFAYGIRNSFGIDFDPVKGALWETDNGPESYDEINRVRQGFDSGWEDIMGPLSRNGGTTGELVVFDAQNSYYKDPKFSWKETVAPTDLHFLDSTVLGNEYQNDMFVGDNNTGTLYHFELRKGRKRLKLVGKLSDRVADNTDTNLLKEQGKLIFGSGFGVISDIETSSDGMYVLSVSDNTLYRIRPGVASAGGPGSGVSGPGAGIPEPAFMGVIIGLAMFMGSRPPRRRG